MTATNAGKGQKAEEALRWYFLSLGYFVVRDVPFSYRGFDVTDVDLWLYQKSSALTRERIMVDVKKRKTPQALERVFWAKGLKEVLDLDRAIVATTDNRKETRDFGVAHGVTVLQGDFLQQVMTIQGGDSRSITEETFFNELKNECILDSSIIWAKYYRVAKACLLTSMNFNGCNLFIAKIRFLIEELLASNKTSQAALRLLYALTAYLLINIDYVLRPVSHLDIDAKKAILAEGFRYGESGKERAEEIVDTALHLLYDVRKTARLSRAQLEEEVKKQLLEYPAEILAEYFAKNEILKQIFSVALEFEKLAYSSSVPEPSLCPVQLKAVIGLLCDFFKIDRRKII